MPCTIATIKLSNNVLLPLRVYVNRKQLLQNIEKSTTENDKSIIEAPLLSNNSIVLLKAPNTRIYLSNKDLNNLCDEIKDDLLFIIYDLTSKEIMEQNFTIGKPVDFKAIIKRFYSDDDERIKGIVKDCHLESIMKTSKFKYKLTYNHNWELNIFINDIKQLMNIRNYLLFKNIPLQLHNLTEAGMLHNTTAMKTRKRVLLSEIQDTPKNDPVIFQEESNDDIEIIEPIDLKPTISYKYQPSVMLPECIEIHVLRRPRRTKHR